ncbi:hypothetical protein SOVF_191140 [Spinacia oleracea]|nr:hypothetical protein SOVF_191140 [Spinacia oleracea]
MTDTHSPNNLLNNAISFLKQKILPSWNQIIRSLRASRGPTFQQAVEIGLLDCCIEALTAHVLSDPTILAQPIMVSNNNNNNNRPMRNSNVTTRRKLFGEGDHSNASSSDTETSLEDLTSLPVKMYKPIVEAMAQRQVPQENIAGSLVQYLNKHGDDSEAIEVIERLLPTSTTCTTNTNYLLYPYTLLFEMHSLAISLKASAECVAFLEDRIGKELYRATAEDLLALDLDIESLRRILKGFYGNFSDPDPDLSGLVAVAELMEEYLLEVAKEREMDARSFTEVAEMACSTSNVGTYRCSDGIYRAVDAYLDKHMELSESEREEVCRVLDFQKMSSQACNHAALNRRLPLRVVVQVLFVSQLQLRDNISKAVEGICSTNSNVDEGSRRRGNEEIKLAEDDEKWDDNDNGERQEIMGRCHDGKSCGKKGKKKMSLWKGMKRKLGCMGTSDYEALYDCNCQLTKKKKKKKKKKKN